MAFKIQPFFNPNPPSIVNMFMEDDRELGRIEKPGTILVNKDITDHEKLTSVIDHENKHIDQLKKGDLDWDDENVYWKGKKFKRSSMKEGSPVLAWEKEAYSK
jgi:hypothetical protein|tara:strand:- start:532 stop:840 length:309 start_codon:yes stop_codon:yes gene_type:complete